MFLACGIQGNRVIGATDEKQFGVNVDPHTLVCDKEKGILVRPEHTEARPTNDAAHQCPQ